MRYSGGMGSDDTGSDKDALSGEFDRLARRYLDLWQSQLSGLSADPALTEQIARLFAAANAQVASAIEAAQAGAHATSAAASSANPGSAPGGSAPRAAPSAAASQHGTDDLGELRKRVAALEARIAELEAKLPPA